MSTSPTTLSDDQMLAIAQSFHEIAFEIAQIRLAAISAGRPLDDPTIIHLHGVVFSLMSASDALALNSANLTLANADQAIAQVKLATQAADRALSHLEAIDKAVTIGSAVIVLAAAISTRNVGQITSAAITVIKSTGLAGESSEISNT
jgi:hypothetical protein